MWWSVYNNVTGDLLAVTSVDPTDRIAANPDWSAHQHADKRPSRQWMWDNATQDWIARPVRVWVDRIDDITGDPRWTNWITDGTLGDVRAKLNRDDTDAILAVFDDRILQIMRDIFAGERFRADSHPVELNDEGPIDTPPS